MTRQNRTRLGLAGALLLLVASWGTGMTVAGFSDTTRNPGNSFSAAPSFCSNPGTRTLLADADAYVEEAAPLKNHGGDGQLEVRSQKSGKNMRALVHFPLPPAPDCTITSARLRLWTSSGDAGRTLEAYVAATDWTEGTVTWATQPPTTGAPSSTSSAVGWIEFDVTAQARSLLSAENGGFLIRDSVEGQSPARAQQFHSRESGGNTPELVIILG